MSDISVKDQFERWNQETKQVFEQTTNEVKSFIKSIQQRLRENTIRNIPVDFGKFLYSCLGDRINGQRQSVLNMDMLNNRGYPDLAKEKNCTIEEYLKKHDKRHNWRNNGEEFYDTQAWFTAGRLFGISYVNAPDRLHTMHIEEGMIFKYLMQEHVDCVKNKLKRKCCQDFLNFRNDFVTGLSKLNGLIDINVPVKIAVVSQIVTGVKYNYMNIYHGNSAAIVIDKVYDDVVKQASFSLPEFDIWDRMVGVNAHTLKHSSDELYPVFSLQFGSVTNDKTVPLTTKVFGNIDISSTMSSNTYDTLFNTNENRILQQNVDSDELLGFNHIVNNAHTNNKKYLTDRNTVFSDGIVMNISDLINHPAVIDGVNKRVDFFCENSKKLQDMKHEYVGLYMTNGDF